MGTFASRNMDDSESLSSGQIHILSSDDGLEAFNPATSTAKMVRPNMDLEKNKVGLSGKQTSGILQKSEVIISTRQSSGLIHKKGQERPISIAAMVCARERGIPGSTSFSKGDCCKISNSFLPNTNSAVRSFQTKIFCGTYIDNGNIFLSASQDRLIRLFDTKKGNFKLVKTIVARDVGWSILDVAVSPDGDYIAYSSWCDCLQICRLWGDTENQEALLLRPEKKRFCIFSLTFSADGKDILCGANDGYIFVYDRECHQRSFIINAHDDDVNAVAFADDTSQILYSGGDDGLCQVWDRRTLNEINPQPVGYLIGHMHGITFIEPRGDGRHLLTNSKDQSIKLWDVRKFSSNSNVNTKKSVPLQNWDYRWQKVPQCLRNPKKRLEGDTSVMTYCGHSVLQTLCRCHFSPAETTGQRYIYTGCASGRVIVYDVLTGQIVRKLAGHSNCVRDAAWHPHRSEIMSTSWDGTIIRWTYNEKKAFDPDEEESSQDILGKGKGSIPRRRSQRLADQKQKWTRENERDNLS